MPKRSRSNSPVSLEEKVDSIASNSGLAVTDSSIAHTPKYFRGSMSPPSSPSAEESKTSHPMHCGLPPHAPITLASAAAFDVHYAQEHTNRCYECNANLPSAWMLELHLNEEHNPLIAAQRDKGEKTYKCFLSDCEKVTSTPEKRRLHLIDKHKYPRNYDFRMVARGVDRRPSALRGGNAPQHGRRRRLSELGERHRQTSNRDRAKEGRNGKGQTSIGELKEQLTTTTAGKQREPTEPSGKLQTSNGEIEASKAISAASDGVDAITSSFSSLQFVPMSVRLKDQRNTH